MKIKMYDIVKLKDGREATIIEVYEQGKAYEADILVDDTGEYPEYETETIKHENIENIVKEGYLMYEIGDKVELKNGSIVIITDILPTVDGTVIYATGNVPIPEENIERKID